MIKILSYQERPNGKEILDRYLYMAAYVLPFSPEDVLGDDVLEVDGQTYTAADFIERSGKRSRQRRQSYRDLLRAQGIPDAAGLPDDKFEQDQLLAAKLIWDASAQLYGYLYQSGDQTIKPASLPPVRRDHLRRLLTSKMDGLDPALKGVGPIVGDGGSLLLDEVFRYDSFADIRGDHVEKLLKAMDVNVCPYCNRLYTTTVVERGEKSRAQFDHYKNKDQYPYLAVSLMNLVPSCGLCNLSKRESDGPVLYPYSDEMGLHAMFRTRIKSGVSYLTGNQDASDEFSVVLELADGLPVELAEKIRGSDERFHLTTLYNRHKDYILYLFWKNYVFSNEYLEELCLEFPEAFHSFEEAKSMMYLMDIEQAQWGRRSLGKLTHDIDAEINGTA